MMKNKVILVLAPHTDDGELGAGGYIHKSIESGAYVTYVAFSDCKESVPEGFKQNILSIECRNATNVLGIQDVRILDLSVRRFPDKRQDILDILIKLRNELNPDEILTPSTSDIHQDHTVVTKEAIRAFKHQTLLGYELPWNCMHFNAHYFIELSHLNINKKMAALDKYESQKNRSYFKDHFLRDYAKFRGKLVNVDYAEAFEVIRMVQKF